MKIHFAESIYWQDIGDDLQLSYAQKVTDSYAAVRELLPTLSEHVNFFVQPREYDLIEETEDSGYIINSELILLAFHPKPRVGFDAILNHIRPTVFHECNHAARYNTGERHESLLQQAIMEGLATAFERDYAGTDPLWGQYDENQITEWLQEIQDIEPGFDWDDYLYKHPDGRKWIAYRTGTFIVDQAVKNTGKKLPTLTTASCQEILNFAGVSA